MCVSVCVFTPESLFTNTFQSVLAPGVGSVWFHSPKFVLKQFEAFKVSRAVRLLIVVLHVWTARGLLRFY
jgi:hypothetical protein